MNYFKEINAFYEWKKYNSISVSSISLWHALMYLNNKIGWREWITLSLTTLEQESGLKRGAVIRARKQLEELGLIKFNTRGSHRAAEYKIISIEVRSLKEHTMEHTSEHTMEHTSALLINNNKNINNKDFKGAHSPKIEFHEFVYLTQEEYEKLTAQFGEEERDTWFIKYASWISSKSPKEQKSRSAYLTILAWSRNDKKNQTATFRPKGTNGRRPLAIVQASTNQLSDEEYREIAELTRLLDQR